MDRSESKDLKNLICGIVSSVPLNVIEVDEAHPFEEASGITKKMKIYATNIEEFLVENVIPWLL